MPIPGPTRLTGTLVLALARSGSLAPQDALAAAEGSHQSREGDFKYSSPIPPGIASPDKVQTVPGKGWNTILRLYGSLEPWFDKTWRPGEIELQH